MDSNSINSIGLFFGQNMIQNEPGEDVQSTHFNMNDAIRELEGPEHEFKSKTQGLKVFSMLLTERIGKLDSSRSDFVIKMQNVKEMYTKAFKYLGELLDIHSKISNIKFEPFGTILNEISVSMSDNVKKFDKISESSNEEILSFINKDVNKDLVKLIDNIEKNILEVSYPFEVRGTFKFMSNGLLFSSTSLIKKIGELNSSNSDFVEKMNNVKGEYTYLSQLLKKLLYVYSKISDIELEPFRTILNEISGDMIGNTEAFDKISESSDDEILNFINKNVNEDLVKLKDNIEKILDVTKSPLWEYLGSNS